MPPAAHSISLPPSTTTDSHMIGCTCLPRCQFHASAASQRCNGAGGLQHADTAPVHLNLTASCMCTVPIEIKIGHCKMPSLPEIITLCWTMQVGAMQYMFHSAAGKQFRKGTAHPPLWNVYHVLAQ